MHDLHFPWDECPRGIKTCKPMAFIRSNTGPEESRTFYCCGKHDGTMGRIEQDKYVSCSKSNDGVDRMEFVDKRDIAHQVAVLSVASAHIREDELDAGDLEYVPQPPQEEGV